jgi:DNA-binding response OmpR family regulator
MSNYSRRIMIVEDDVRMSHFYRMTLEQEGFSVAVESTSASDALTKVKNTLNGDYAKSARPEIVICDKNLPDGMG